MSSSLNATDEVGKITPKMLQTVCKKNDLYTTPSLNDRLYLHFQGIREIENLDEYENLHGICVCVLPLRESQPRECFATRPSCFRVRYPHVMPSFSPAALWLENNAIERIQNLSHLRLLGSL